MRRVLSVVLIAAFSSMMLGIDRTSWAGQAGDQKKRDKQHAAVVKSLSGMRRGTTAALVRQDGTRTDVVIQEITADSITVLRDDRGQVVTETIPIVDIATIKKANLKRGMSLATKVALGVAVGLGVLVVGGLAACAAAADPRKDVVEATR